MVVPERSLTLVKEPASMVSCPRAMRQSTEFAAKAVSARKVSKAVFQLLEWSSGFIIWS